MGGMDEFGYGGGGGGGGGGEGGAPKSASSSASSASAIQFGNSLLNSDAGLTPLAGVILAAVALIAFVGLIIVARK